MQQNVGRRDPKWAKGEGAAGKVEGGAILKAPPPSRKVPLQGAEKRLRALNKLLRDMEALQEREAAGEELDEQQQAKLDRMEDVLSEMDELLGGG